MRAPTPNLNKALSLLQGELPRIAKGKTAEVKNDKGQLLYKYSYADLGDVVADIGPLLAKHGLAFHCGPTINPDDRREMILIWSLLHESGEEKTGEWPLGPVNQKPQSLGGAITYGRRYCFTAATNIVLEDDDDGQRAQQDHSRRESAGDAFENATSARPPRQGGGNGGSRGQQRPAAAEDAQQASPPDWSRWLTGAVTLAPNHASLDACRAAWKRAAELVSEGKLTQADVAPLQVALRKRMGELKAPKPDGLPSDSPWALKIEECVTAEDGEAVLVEAVGQHGDGQIDAARLGQIEDALVARFPQLRRTGQEAA